MTKGRAALPGRIVAEQATLLSPLVDQMRRSSESRRMKFVNDDLVDVIITPEPQGDFASVQQLATVTGTESDPTLAPAKGQVYAKTGTYVGLAGRSGAEMSGIRRLCDHPEWKEARVSIGRERRSHHRPRGHNSGNHQSIEDEGTISAILWRHFQSGRIVAFSPRSIYVWFCDRFGSRQSRWNARWTSV
jgi:hypothetical protein